MKNSNNINSGQFINSDGTRIKIVTSTQANDSFAETEVKFQQENQPHKDTHYEKMNDIPNYDSFKK